MTNQGYNSLFDLLFLVPLCKQKSISRCRRIMWIDRWRAKGSSQKYLKNEKIIDICNKKGILLNLDKMNPFFTGNSMSKCLGRATILPKHARRSFLPVRYYLSYVVRILGCFFSRSRRPIKLYKWFVNHLTNCFGYSNKP